MWHGDSVARHGVVRWPVKSDQEHVALLLVCPVWSLSRPPSTPHDTTTSSVGVLLDTTEWVPSSHIADTASLILSQNIQGNDDRKGCVSPDDLSFNKQWPVYVPATVLYE